MNNNVLNNKYNLYIIEPTTGFGTAHATRLLRFIFARNSDGAGGCHLDYKYYIGSLMVVHCHYSLIMFHVFIAF
jgi:hypothetical protein